jgi:LPS-assembly lipoprotein
MKFSFSSNRTRRACLSCGLVVLALTLAGCGFQLRGAAPQLAFKQVAWRGVTGPVSNAVSEALRSQGADSTRSAIALNASGTNAEGDAPSDIDLVIEVSVDQRERQVVASTIAGQVRELDLRVRFNWQAFNRTGQPITPTIEMVLSQDLSYQESAVLSKSLEQDAIYDNLQARMVAQVMRRLSALQPGVPAQ